MIDAVAISRVGQAHWSFCSRHVQVYAQTRSPALVRYESPELVDKTTSSKRAKLVTTYWMLNPTLFLGNYYICSPLVNIISGDGTLTSTVILFQLRCAKVCCRYLE